MSVRAPQQFLCKASQQRAFFARKPVAVRATRVASMAQLSQDELKQQVGRQRQRRLRPPPAIGLAWFF
jgi:hypothetical protein